MEPFVSPDGNYLFFNNSNSAPTTNLYYATRIDDVDVPVPGRDWRRQVPGRSTHRRPLDGYQQHLLFHLEPELRADPLHYLLGDFFQRQSLERRAGAGSFKRQIGRREFRPMHQPRWRHIVFRGRRLHRRPRFRKPRVSRSQSATAITSCGSRTAPRSCARSTPTTSTMRPTCRSRDSSSSLPGFRFRIRSLSRRLSSIRRRAQARQSRLATSQNRSDHRIRRSARTIARREITLLPPTGKRDVRHLSRHAPVTSTPRRCRAARRSLPTCSRARAALPRYAARVRARPPPPS